MTGARLVKLQSLIAAVVPANPFYTAKLSGLRIETLDDFANLVPFTTKEELVRDQLAHPPYGSNLTYAPSRYSRFCQTSGSTGTPMRWLDTEESWNWLLSCWNRVYQAAQVTPADRVFFAFSFGPFLGFWTAFEAACRMGCLAIPGGGMRSAARLSLMLETSATVLCCTPTYAMHLAEIAAEENIDLSRMSVRKIIVAGEPGGSIPAVRSRIESLWNGAQVVDHHGMTEIGPVTYGCPVCPGLLHVIEDEFYAEIIDGELVLTNFGRTGSPLIRYRTGDIVQAAEPSVCACGSRELALQGGILGRTDDMVVVRGVNVYPSAVEEILRGCGGVAEYRVHISQHLSLTELSLEVEPAHADDGLPHRIEAALRDALSLRIPVSLVAPGSLPRFEMKARRWLKR